MFYMVMDLKGLNEAQSTGAISTETRKIGRLFCHCLMFMILLYCNV